MVVRVGDVVNNQSMQVIYNLFDSPIKHQTSDSARLMLLRTRNEISNIIGDFEQKRQELLDQIGVEREEEIKHEDKETYYMGLYELGKQEVEIENRLPMAALKWVDADFSTNDIGIISYLLEETQDENECTTG